MITPHLCAASRFSIEAALLDARLIEQAFDLAAPLIDAALAEPAISGERVLHVVVADTAYPDFDEAVQGERSFGQTHAWGADYRAFARAKARLCWRTSLDTRYLQQSAPHLLRAGDTLLWGSACRDGLIVAASGAQPWFDEAFSGVVLELVRALVQAKRRAVRPVE